MIVRKFPKLLHFVNVYYNVYSLRNKCPYLELFWFAAFLIAAFTRHAGKHGQEKIRIQHFLCCDKTKTQSNDPAQIRWSKKVLCTRDDLQELFAISIDQCFCFHKVYSENETSKI